MTSFSDVQLGGPLNSPVRRHRWRSVELAWWGIALSIFFLFPGYLNFATSILVMALFALSLSLILGFAGIITLGHAVFFGIGAYGAGLIALAGWTEPITGVLVGGAAAAAVAALSGPLILGLAPLPLVMVTLGLGAIFFEAANKATWLTGGVDGLYGIELRPLFGRFDWSIYGSTQYLYALAWLALLFFIVRRVIASPFGLALEGIRENGLRMRVLGAPVLRQLTLCYTISAFIAGIAGALSAQTTAFVGLIVFSLETSVDALLIVILGGLGSPYGALVGAPVYMSIKYFSQQWNPHLWMLFVGLILILVTVYGRGGLIGLFQRFSRRQAANDRPGA